MKSQRSTNDAENQGDVKDGKHNCNSRHKPSPTKNQRHRGTIHEEDGRKQGGTEMRRNKNQGKSEAAFAKKEDVEVHNNESLISMLRE